MKKILIALVLWMHTSIAYAMGTIILLVDVSSSINNEQMALQINSYAKSMLSIPTLRYVQVEVVTFATDPVHISSGNYEEAAAAFASYTIFPYEERGTTCLANALDYIESILPTLPPPVILDISGDGQANCGEEERIPLILNRMAVSGLRVNTLYINNPENILGPDQSDPRAFYQSLTRNNGFSIEARGFQDFELALWEKLILELSMLEN